MSKFIKNVLLALTIATSSTLAGNVIAAENTTSHFSKHHSDAKKRKGKNVHSNKPKTKKKVKSYDKEIQTGLASWYGKKFIGRKTASGERLNTSSLTAAHKHLPLGSIVKVTNVLTKDVVLVTINDRGPFIRGRILDLSPAAAKEIGLMNTGIAKVTMEVVQLPM